MQNKKQRQCSECNSFNYYARGWCVKCYEKNTRQRGVCTSCGAKTCRTKYAKCSACSNREQPKHSRPHSQESREKMRKNNWRAHNENHPQWKGGNVGYYALHRWIRKHKEVPKGCENCGKECVLHASNKDHKYSRNLEDWQFLCPKCHKEYDVENGLVDTKGSRHHQWGKSPSIETRKKISDTLKKRIKI